MRAFCVILALLAGSCWPKGDDPYEGLASDPCSPGNVRGISDSCVAATAAIVIDGDVADWTAIAEIPLDLTCAILPCDDLRPSSLQFVRGMDAQGNPTIAFRLRLADGAAPNQANPAVRYVLELSETSDYPTGGEVDAFVAGDSAVHFLKNAYTVDPPAGQPSPFAFAWTSDGFEAMVRVEFLPFPFGARVAVYALVRDGNEWLHVTPPAPVARACWLDAFTPSESSIDDYAGDPCRLVTPP